MNHIGEYKGYPCYQIDYHESTDYAPNRILVDPLGKMWYGGVQIGRLDPHTYSVKQFDMQPYEREMARRARIKAEQEKAEKRVAAEKAKEKTEVTSTVGTEDFFAAINKEIDRVLAGSKDFDFKTITAWEPK